MMDAVINNTKSLASRIHYKYQVICVYAMLGVLLVVSSSCQIKNDYHVGATGVLNIPRLFRIGDIDKHAGERVSTVGVARTEKGGARLYITSDNFFIVSGHDWPPEAEGKRLVLVGTVGVSQNPQISGNRPVQRYGGPGDCIHYLYDCTWFVCE